MKPILTLAAIFLTLASLASAEEITVAQEEYWLGETVQAEVLMDAFDLTKLSLVDNASNKIAVGFLTIKLHEKQFVYFNIPAAIAPGEYFLTAKDKRVVDDEIQDFEMSAKILVTANLGLSIDPAIVFIDPLKDEFKIAIKNNAAETITTNVTTPEGLKAARKELQIEPGEVKNAFISYSGLEEEKEVALIYLNRSYKIRIIAPATKETPQEEPTEETPEETTETGELKFDGPETVEKKASRYTSFSDPITVKSTTGELSNVKFTLTGNLEEVVELKIETIDALPARGEIRQYVWVNKDKKAGAGIYEGNLKVEADEGYSDTLHLKITLEELELIEEKADERPSEKLFNQTKISVLINETATPEEEPSVAKNVTIALSLLATVAIIAAILWKKLQTKTKKKTLGEHVKSMKK